MWGGGVRSLITFTCKCTHECEHHQKGNKCEINLYNKILPMFNKWRADLPNKFQVVRWVGNGRAELLLDFSDRHQYAPDWAVCAPHSALIHTSEVSLLLGAAKQSTCTYSIKILNNLLKSLDILASKPRKLIKKKSKKVGRVSRASKKSRTIWSGSELPAWHHTLADCIIRSEAISASLGHSLSSWFQMVLS